MSESTKVRTANGAIVTFVSPEAKQAWLAKNKQAKPAPKGKK